MFRIVEAAWLAPDIRRVVVEAPRVASKHRAGHFVIVRVHDHGERIPLTICEADPDRGTITLVVQSVGKTTRLLNSLVVGDAILDVVGPLGRPTDVRRVGEVVVVGGGVGTAIAYPVALAMARSGNLVTGIVGARTAALVLLQRQMTAACDRLFVCTDDGSAGTEGLVTDRLRDLIADRPAQLVFAVGPIPMMKAVAETTRDAAIPTVVSLNAIMVDGTGMCGGCRVAVAGHNRFACVDGPDFDAHQVDFDVLARRNRLYRTDERRALEAHLAHPERDTRRLEAGCQLAVQREGRS